MKKKLKRFSGYLFMPLSFMLFGYGVIALALSPFFEVAVAASSLLMLDEAPNFSRELSSIFDEDQLLSDLDYIHISDIEIPTFGTQYGQLSSTNIGLNVPVFWGDSYEILRHGVGHHMGSFLPGFNGTLLLAGHNMTHFLPLQDIEVGDIVELTTNFAHFKYEVTDIRVLHIGNASAFDLSQRDQEILVMYTCYPFSFAGITDYRMFVYANRISGPDVIYQTESE